MSSSFRPKGRTEIKTISQKEIIVVRNSKQPRNPFPGCPNISPYSLIKRVFRRPVYTYPTCPASIMTTCLRFAPDNTGAAFTSPFTRAESPATARQQHSVTATGSFPLIFFQIFIIRPVLSYSFGLYGNEYVGGVGIMT